MTLDFAAVRRIKKELFSDQSVLEQLAEVGRCTGVGIGGDGSDFRIRVYMHADPTLYHPKSFEEACDDLPSTYKNVPVEYINSGNIKTS